MRKYIILIILFAITRISFAQDQIVSGTLKINRHLILQTDGLANTPIGEYGNRLYFGSSYPDNGDVIYMARYNAGSNQSDLRINIGDDSGAADRFVVGNIKWDSNNTWKDWFVVTESGVGIKTSHPSTALEVAGTIRAKEVKIEATGWSDFVFDKSYNLPKLSDVEKHINDRQHLPGIPSEKEVLENGVNVVDMQAKLLQKIEELTLYMIEQDKRIDEQNKQISLLKEQLTKVTLNQ